MTAIDAVLTASRGKGGPGTPSGALKLARRLAVISRRYGATPARFDRTLTRFVETLGQFDCGATFPITTVALVRSPGVVEKHQAHNVEFAVHGYRHVDHTQLSSAQQVAELATAARLFRERGLAPSGFRCPYLRWNADTLAAVREVGFLYEASQALSWDLVGDADRRAYEHVLQFYGAVSAADYPALPRWEGGPVRIPYCLPDDEALADRLRLGTAAEMSQEWLAILERTHATGELFTLGLHPERFAVCGESLAETLRQARGLAPSVWIARLDEIARWWIARTEAVVTVSGGAGDEYHLSVAGPEGVTILARGVETRGPTAGWDGAYRRVKGSRLSFRADRRPFIGVSPTSSPHLSRFLRQQGYIVEPADDRGEHTIYLDRPAFGERDERPLLDEIEGGGPLVKLGRWPGGARSALCVTGDIDALTIWDYWLRAAGR